MSLHDVRVTVASMIAAGALVAASPAGAAPTLEVGRPFPDIVLPALDDGRPMSVAQFRGTRLMLQVFASW